ncbi:hypothetical protein HCN44_009715 [Aphidius gifuensis]|uniref:Protein KRI1 homolog n=1 Tax=Aphidius gifuensis TaxID=684658 RepID=A0A834Y7X9_APHGI|nr:protein KRI1 homolog [Aphidius gifuensis]KAF7998317.1 hypothetical protein HCN44_009715 [Aphidius gifuensis]
MPKLLFDDDDDNKVEDKVTINKEYAASYKNWRAKEELHKLKAKYGDDYEESSSDNSSTSGDDDPEDQEFDEKFLRTLACLKSQDPLIHDKNYEFFPEVPEEQVKKKVKKNKEEKLMSVHDYERERLLECDGKFSDSEDEQEFHNKKITNQPTYVEKQNELLKNLKDAIALDDDDDGEDFLIPKKTTEEVKEKKKKNDDLLKKDEKLKPLYDYWTDPNLPSHEKFLRDYIQKKKFLNNDSDSDDDYKDRVHDSDENLSEDEKNIENQELFEHKYNYRFEEPDPEFIKSYPRTMEGTLRKKDTRRSEKRAEIKLRKEEDKKRKKEELLKLKAMKRKEIEDKIEKLKEITGNDDMQFDANYIEEDFDPEQHEKMMQQMFDDKYYEEGADEGNKPEFPDLDKELELETNWDDYNPKVDKEIYYDDDYNEPGTSEHCEDENFNMDADYYTNRMFQKELIESSKKKRKRSKFAEMIAQDKPQFDPKVHTSLKKFIEMYYDLDYEDMIGDTPCKFKYRKVEPNDYGLTVEEILMADEKELNKWCSLKNALKHKTPEEEKYEIKKYKQKAQNEEYKKKIIPSLYKPIDESENEDDDNNNVDDTENKKKRKRNKKKKSDNVNVNVDGDDKNKITSTNSMAIDQDNATDIKPVDSENKNITDDVNNNKKNKKPRKKKLKTDESVNNEKVEETIDETEKSSEKNKNKKQKNKSVDNVEEEKINGTEKSSETNIKTKINKNKSVDDEKVEEKIDETEKPSKKNKKQKNKSVDDEKVEEKIDETEKPSEKNKNKKQKNKSVDNVEEEKINGMKKSTEVNIKTEEHENKSADQMNNVNGKKLTQAERKQKYKKLKKLRELEAKTAATAASLDQINNGNGKKLTQAERREKYLKIKKLKELKAKTTEMNKLIPDMTDSRLKAYGLNPKKFKNKLKYGKKIE